MNTHPVDQYLRTLTRRQLFQRVGLGVGGFALANLLNNDLSAAPKNPFSHFAPKAKNVIYFHLVGAPSHLDLFDYKPELQKRNGELCPKEMFEGKQLAFIRSRPALLGTSKESKYEFTKCGKSRRSAGHNLLLICRPWPMICVSFGPCMPSSLTMLLPRCLCRRGSSGSGDPVLERGPNYGIGSPNKDLPGFVVMVTGQYPGAGNSVFRQWISSLRISGDRISRKR